MKTRNTWTYQVTEDDEEERMYVIEGRYMSDLDMAAISRLVVFTDVERNTIATTPNGLAVILLTRYFDVTLTELFRRCIKSHKIGDAPDADFSVYQFEQQERDDIFDMIVSPMFPGSSFSDKIAGIAPEREGAADAESFPDLVQEKPGDTGGQVQDATPPTTPDV